MTDAHEVIPAQSREVAAPADQATSLLQVIERAASNPDVDLDRMERLMAMHERMMDQRNQAEFSAALSRVQGATGRIAADAKNPQTRSQYASYGALDKALRPIYTKECFSLSFDTAESPIEGHVRVVCIIAHANGATQQRHIDMPADGKGAKGGDVMTKTHATGSAVSYGMRYLLKMIFNVAVGEDDDDGNAAGVAYITQDQQDTLQALIEDVGADKAKFLTHMRAEGGLAYIRAEHYESAVKALEKKRGQA
jgi:hypothetical protein